MARDVSLPRVCFRCGSPAAPRSDYCPACLAAMRRPGLHHAELNWERIARLLSLIPILLGPPVAALLISFRRMKSTRPGSVGREVWQTTIVIAVANIVLSLLVWHVAAGHAEALAIEAFAWLRALMGVGAQTPSGVIGA